MGGQRVEHRAERPVRAQDVAIGQRGGRHQRQEGELGDDLPAARQAADRAGHQHRVERQQQVEGDLDAQRPRRGDALQHVVVAVDLAEAVEQPEVAGEHARDAGVDRQHGQRQPVGGHDPQDPPAQVARQRRPAGAVQPRGDERAVEQEARDREEDRHPHLGVGDEARRPGHGQAAGVADDDGDRGDRAQRIDQREARMPGRRGASASGAASEAVACPDAGAMARAVAVTVSECRCRSRSSAHACRRRPAPARRRDRRSAQTGSGRRPARRRGARGGAGRPAAAACAAPSRPS